MSVNSAIATSITPPFGTQAQARRKSGRAKGSMDQTVQYAKALGVHHFAFVRYSVLGLDLADSSER